MLKNKVFLSCVMMFFAMGVSAAPISYQGQLNDAGAPANGIYDILFQIFDAETGGTQIGVDFTAEDIEVVDGLFRAAPDFGAVFDSADVWLRVFVRPGASNGALTELLPRQRINDVPKAAYATVAETSLDSFWGDAGDNTISFGSGTDKVVINRDSSISPFEFFGVHADTTGLGGMFISTPDGGFPMYAYVVNNVLNSFTFYRPGNDSWVVWVGGQDVLQTNGNGDLTALGGIDAGGNVVADGDVFAAGGVVADDYQLNAPRTLTYSVSGDSFHSGSNSAFFGGDVAGGAYQAQSGGGWLMAPVNLPDGAVITAMHATYLDNATGNMTVALQTRTISGSLIEIAAVSSSGTSTAVQTGTTNTVTDGIVDNASRGYHLRVFSSNWPGNLLLRVFGVRIEYTIEEVQ